AIVTPGYRGALFAEPPAPKPDLVPGAGARSASGEKVVDGMRIALEAAGLMAGRKAALHFRLTDMAGAPITDLEPFLGAPAHVLVVRNDLQESVHAHPEERATAGPVVTVDPLLPSSGVYKLWAQFQRQGKVTTVSFVFEVARP